MNINDIKELKVKDVFESQVLEDLFEIRDDGFKATYNIIFDNPEECKGMNLDEIESKIKEIVEDKEQQKQILELFNENYEKSMNEVSFWSKAYYKYGFLDGKYMNKELVQICLLNKHIREHKKGIIFNKIMNTIKEIIKCKKD